jgi:hypothetical protein
MVKRTLEKAPELHFGPTSQFISLKPLKIVCCSFCDGVPLKFSLKIRAASSSAVLTVSAYSGPLLKFAG